MKTKIATKPIALVALLAVTLAAPTMRLVAQESSLGSFTYQGRLNDASGAANGLFDFQFSLYPSSFGTNNQVDTTITRQFVAVSNGLFAVKLAFPLANSSFNGSDRWLEIAVKPSGVPTNYFVLNPRQQITAAPYAIKSDGASVATTAYSVPGVRVNTNAASTALGLNTAANGNTSTAMGFNTTANGASSTAMGQSTVAGGDSATAMGAGTIANGTYSIAMGHLTAAGGFASTAMGKSTTANGTHSLAAGTQARALHDGTFVWADNRNADFASTGTNQFLIRASGGVGINNNNPTGAALAVGGNVNVEGIVSVNALSAASVTTPQLYTPHLITPRLGTTSNVPVEVLVNNQRGLRLEATAFADAMNVIGGSAYNFVGAGAVGATIGGGGGSSFLQSSNANSVEGDFSTVSGGAGNAIQIGSQNATIAGGVYNTILPNADQSFIGGGFRNNVHTRAFSGVIGGGALNEILFGSELSTIGGGYQNTIQSNVVYGTIGGGFLNTILMNAVRATIGGGDQNTAGGNYATVPGGVGNNARGHFSFAAGHNAQALHDGTFVWADSQLADFASTANNQFSIRASGGLRLSDSTSMNFGSQPRQMLNLWSTNYGIGVQASSLYFRCNDGGANDGFIWYKGGTHNDAYANAGGGTELMHLVQGGLYVNGALVSTSDRNAKENFQPVSPREVLEKVAALPMSSWNYKADTATRHLGPMAQDFHAAFGVGPDDKHIATVDADGVALAAIQGLNQKVDGLKGELKRRDAENAELKQRLEALERIILNQKANQENTP